MLENISTCILSFWMFALLLSEFDYHLPGSETVNQIFRVLLSTNMAVGGFTGFILDNLLPGTIEERGILKWKQNFSADGSMKHVSSIHVYDPPFLTKKFMRSKFCKYVPFLPYYGDEAFSPKVEDVNVSL